MPPLVPDPSSEEDVDRLQREVKVLQERLSTTVTTNERALCDLSEKLDAEKEKVLQVDKDKRFVHLTDIAQV